MFRKMFLAALLTAISLLSQQATAQLKSPDNQADYIIIYPNEFHFPIWDFESWRNSKGVNVKSVGITELMEEFNTAFTLEDNIRDFVSYALEFWQEPKPKYLLLAGGINLIPGFKVFDDIQFPGDSITIDNYYSINKYEPDDEPDIALGRLPARNSQELINMFDKIIQFEDNNFDIDYSSDALITTDSKNYQLFESIADGIINKFPKNLKVSRFSVREDSEFYGTKEDFINKLNDGSVFLYNLINANTKVWTNENILNSDDIDLLNLDAKPFIIMSLSGYINFDNPEIKSINEKLLSKKDAGAVAIIGSTGANFADPTRRLIESFNQEVFDKKTERIGDAFLRAKLSNSGSSSEKFTLLGDPMLKIPNRIFAGIDDNANTNNEVLQIFPNPITAKAKIEFNLLENSDVSIELFDLLGNNCGILFNGNLNEGKNQIECDFSEFMNGAYCIKLHSGQEIQSKFIVISR